MRRVESSARLGFTLVEMLVAMTLTLVVFAITLPFVRVQTRALGANAGRLDAEQIARYAQRAIDRDLRLAVADPGQPLLVYAGPMGIAFNANLVAVDTTDPAALEVDATAPASLTESWALADAAPLPLTTTTFPTTTYLGADGQPSHNETISYFLHPDTVSDRSDIYVLYRQVNARDSVQLVRGIHVPDDSAFFTYFRMDGDSLAEVSSGGLPWFWDSDSIGMIRAVGLRSAGFYRNVQEAQDVIRTVYWRTVLVNAAPAVDATCGTAPGGPSGLGQSKQTGSEGFHVRLSWNASPDDGGGAGDVTHYVLRLRSVATGDTIVVASVPALQLSFYRYEHHLPYPIGTVKYGITAVDCGGAASTVVEHSSNLSLP